MSRTQVNRAPMNMQLDLVQFIRVAGSLLRVKESAERLVLVILYRIMSQFIYNNINSQSQAYKYVIRSTTVWIFSAMLFNLKIKLNDHFYIIMMTHNLINVTVKPT